MASSNGYGAVEHSAPTNGNANGGDSEQQPLLGNGDGNGKRTSASIRKALTVDVSRDWADIVLLLSYITTGLLDSASISAWGSFVSMQTGITDHKKLSTRLTIISRKHNLHRPWSGSPK